MKKFKCCWSDLLLILLLYVPCDVSASVNVSKIPTYGFCVDRNCSKAVAEGVTQINFRSTEENVLSSPSQQKVRILNRSFDKKSYSFVEINGKLGFFPTNLFREEIVHYKPNDVNVTVQFIISKEEPKITILPVSRNISSEQEPKPPVGSALPLNSKITISATHDAQSRQAKAGIFVSADKALEPPTQSMGYAPGHSPVFPDSEVNGTVDGTKLPPGFGETKDTDINHGSSHSDAERSIDEQHSHEYKETADKVADTTQKSEEDADITDGEQNEDEDDDKDEEEEEEEEEDGVVESIDYSEHEPSLPVTRDAIMKSQVAVNDVTESDGMTAQTTVPVSLSTLVESAADGNTPVKTSPQSSPSIPPVVTSQPPYFIPSKPVLNGERSEASTMPPHAVEAQSVNESEALPAQPHLNVGTPQTLNTLSSEDSDANATNNSDSIDTRSGIHQTTPTLSDSSLPAVSGTVPQHATVNYTDDVSDESIPGGSVAYDSATNILTDTDSAVLSSGVSDSNILSKDAVDVSIISKEATSGGSAEPSREIDALNESMVLPDNKKAASDEKSEVKSSASSDISQVPSKIIESAPIDVAGSSPYLSTQDIHSASNVQEPTPVPVAHQHPHFYKPSVPLHMDSVPSAQQWPIPAPTAAAPADQVTGAQPLSDPVPKPALYVQPLFDPVPKPALSADQVTGAQPLSDPVPKPALFADQVTGAQPLSDPLLKSASPPDLTTGYNPSIPQPFPAGLGSGQLPSSHHYGGQPSTDQYISDLTLTEQPLASQPPTVQQVMNIHESSDSNIAAPSSSTGETINLLPVSETPKNDETEHDSLDHGLHGSEIPTETSPEVSDYSDPSADDTGPQFELWDYVVSLFSSEKTDDSLQASIPPPEPPSVEDVHLTHQTISQEIYDNVAETQEATTCVDGSSDAGCPQESLLPLQIEALFSGLGVDSILTRIIAAAVTLLLCIFAYFYIEKRRMDGRLVARVNCLERELMARTKEIALLKEACVDQGQQAQLLDELNDAKAARAELEEQVATLERDLDEAAEANMELNQMLEQTLDNPKGSAADDVLASVERLQAQLDGQRDIIGNMTRSLSTKNAEIEALKAQLTETRESISGLEAEVATLNETIANLRREKEDANIAHVEKLQEVQNQLAEALANKVLEESRLGTELSSAKLNLKRARQAVIQKESEVEALQDSIRQFKSGGVSDEKLSKLFDAVKLHAQGQQLTQERDELEESLRGEGDARKRLEDHVRVIEEEVNKLRINYEEAQREKSEAQTRLEVLSNYFKEKESQLKKELEVQEVLIAQQRGDENSVLRRVQSLQEEVETYRSQNESLKREILDQERDFKGQIATLEKKSHDNWVSARQAERKLEESRQEASQLRNRLTVVEKSINASTDGAGGVEANGDGGIVSPVMGLPGMGPMGTLMGPMGPIIPPPPPPIDLDASFMFPPLSPGALPPHPHPHFMPPLPPPPLLTGDRRPPPLGRMSSPPPAPPPPPGHFSPPPPHFDRLERPSQSPSPTYHRPPPGGDRAGFRPFAKPSPRKPTDYRGPSLSSGQSSESTERARTNERV